MKRRPHLPAILLLAAILLPLAGGLRAAHATPRHPCGAAMPAAPAQDPAGSPTTPCGAVIQLPCCHEAAVPSSASGVSPQPQIAFDGLPAPSAWSLPLTFVPAAPPCIGARAAPLHLATTLLRI